MTFIDWMVVAVYLAGLILLSWYLARKQKSGNDYFLGGKKVNSTMVALSLAANQISAISLIGAPAFVALNPDGGLKWLQYELAVPLAMVAIIIFILPSIRRISGPSIFKFLENRFDIRVRLSLSLVFIISRGLATGIVLYTSALVLSVTLNLPLSITFVLLGIIAITYTTLGGISADIISDAAQLLILVCGTIVALIIVWNLVGGFASVQKHVSSEKTTIIEFGNHGLGDSQDFGFWPMLLGGLFLYISYYGCDQSQAQRLMSTSSHAEARKSLVINGLIRLPIVLAYCLLGLGLAAFIAQNTSWAQAHNLLHPGEMNKLVPYFILDYLPQGVAGLMMAGIFAATMSTIDSSINSLGAVTMSDFVDKCVPSLKDSQRRYVLISRIVTALWGIFCLISGYLLGQLNETVIVLVNKVGSLFYGPVLAVFLAGMLLKKVSSNSVLAGLIAGFTVNLAVMIFLPSVSWLWWNVIGFSGTFIVATLSRSSKENQSIAKFSFSFTEIKYAVIVLLSAFIVILLLLLAIERVFS